MVDGSPINHDSIFGLNINGGIKVMTKRGREKKKVTTEPCIEKEDLRILTKG